MDLDEMKALWQDMSSKLEQQQKLTDKIIIKMTQDKYRDKIGRISLREIPGSIFCFIVAAYLLFYFGDLSTWYLQVCGAFTIAFYLIIPLLSLNAIAKMRGINISENTYNQTLLEFTQARSHFLFVQKLALGLGFVLVFASLPVFANIISGKDMFLDPSSWIWIAIMLVFLFFFGRWGYGHYERITNKAESILKEMEG